MKASEWIFGFLDEHRGRFQPHDWPETGTEEYTVLIADWVEAFDGPGVTLDEATRASRRLSRVDPPQWRREHLPAIVETIAKMRTERAAPADVVASMDAARAVSLDCPYCHGQGLVTVWHPRPDPEKRIAPTAAAHCVCPAGRFMRKRIAQEDAQVLRRIPDYEDVLKGRSAWLDMQPNVTPVEGAMRAALGGRKPGPSFLHPVRRSDLAAIGKPVLPDRILTPEAAAVADEVLTDPTPNP